MDRRTFIRISGGVCAATGLRLRVAAPRPIDEGYLERGLRAMARATGWFDVHWGAGMVAGYYLCQENALDESTTAAIRAELDVVMTKRPKLFAAASDAERDAAPIADAADRIVAALRPAVADGLRAHGHAVIFAALAVKGLRDVPRLASAELVAGLLAPSRTLASRKARRPEVGKPYADVPAMIDAVVRSLLRFESLRGHPGVRHPNFTHWLTHTDAIATLDAFGFGEVARAAQLGHRAHIDEPVPDVSASEAMPAKLEPATLTELTSAPFWRREDNRTHWQRPFDAEQNRNGDWVASGHLFKLLYAWSRLARRIDDPDHVRRCSAIVLQRYRDPAVNGG